MAGNLGELVQMISALSDIQARKRQLALGEATLAENARQFATQGEEQNFASALKLIAGSSAKAREGYGQLLSTLSPEHRAAAEAFLSGQPIDPTVTHAQDIQAGHAAMSPQMLGTVQQESAVQNATGMNVGATASSQLLGQLASQAAPFITPDVAHGYAERVATGRTPGQAAVENAQIAGGMIPTMALIAGGLQQSAGQAAQTAVAREGINFQYAQLDHEERKFAAYYGLDKMLKTAEAQKAAGAAGGLTGAAYFEALKSMTGILNDINKNTSDEASNMARRRLYNHTNAMLGNPLPPLPIAGEGAPGKVGLPTQLWRGVTGMGPGLGGTEGGIAWPIMTQPDLGGRR